MKGGDFSVKKFNTTGICVPEKHYMVDITERLEKMEEMVGKCQYFTVNRARQYGKTTTLNALEHVLEKKYVVVSLDFQDIGNDSFVSEGDFCKTFSRILLATIEENEILISDSARTNIQSLISKDTREIRLDELSSVFAKLCRESERPVVMIIDEVDSATNNQVFLDFLAQLRSAYLKREKNPKFMTFQTVILAGVTDVKNLKRKIHPNEKTDMMNSPWNIATDFKIDMSFNEVGIAGMLREYEADHKTGMQIGDVARILHEYTGGYPYLVSRVCQVLDEELVGDDRFCRLCDIWTNQGISEAVRRILSEQNTLFDSLMGKIKNSEKLKYILRQILFSGENIGYNMYDESIYDAMMFGFIRNDRGIIQISNRIFETLLYNYYLADDELKNMPIYKSGADERDVFVQNGHLNMEYILERYIVCFNDIYGDNMEKFVEEEGRRRFLLYIRPIINGTGNYYIEARTRNNKKMDVVIDYLGERFVVELKIWRGNAYNERGEKQLSDYLEYYHLEKGYMLSYNFNKKKKAGIRHIALGNRVLVEAIV